MKKLLLLDNYDSFTYNLQDYFLQLGLAISVFRNDEITISQIEDLNPDGIVFSPGPGRPEESGTMMDIIQNFHQVKPMLGICLGHQALGIFFGESLQKARLPVHGKTSVIKHLPHPLFDDIPEHLSVMRYHSLLVTELQNPALEPLAWTESDELMAFVHRTLPIAALQFHPESILTEYGLQILRNWVKWAL
ncbi:MAG: aminodeoxychorismate/anthranilate synthase component II [Saprospiraceae bacterium]